MRRNSISGRLCRYWPGTIETVCTDQDRAAEAEHPTPPQSNWTTYRAEDIARALAELDPEA